MDYVTLFRWVQRFTPELSDAAGVCRYVYRAVDQHGQVIDVYVSRRRDIAQARFFITSAPRAYRTPSEVITDHAPALANVTPDLIPAAFQNTGHYENNRCEADHGRLKARLRPMHELTTAFDERRLAT